MSIGDINYCSKRMLRQVGEAMSLFCGTVDSTMVDCHEERSDNRKPSQPCCVLKPEGMRASVAKNFQGFVREGEGEVI